MNTMILRANKSTPKLFRHYADSYLVLMDFYESGEDIDEEEGEVSLVIQLSSMVEQQGVIGE